MSKLDDRLKKINSYSENNDSNKESTTSNKSSNRVNKINSIDTSNSTKNNASMFTLGNNKYMSTDNGAYKIGSKSQSDVDYLKEEKTGHETLGTDLGQSIKGGLQSWGANQLSTLASLGIGAKAIATGDNNYTPEKGTGLWKLAEAASANTKAANELIEDSKEGRGGLGSLVMDVSSQAVMNGIDTAIKLIPGVGEVLGTASFASRSFGASSQQARDEGKSVATQLLSGTVSSAIETATEALWGFGGTRGIPETGILQKQLNKAMYNVIEKTNISPVVAKLAMSFGTEATEEMLSDILNPIASGIINAITSDDGAFGDYEGEEWQGIGNMLYDGLVGGISGVGGGLISAVQTASQVKNAGSVQNWVTAERENTEKTVRAATITEALEKQRSKKTSKQIDKVSKELSKSLGTDVNLKNVEANAELDEIYHKAAKDWAKDTSSTMNIEADVLEKAAYSFLSNEEYDKFDLNSVENAQKNISALATDIVSEKAKKMTNEAKSEKVKKLLGKFTEAVEIRSNLEKAEANTAREARKNAAARQVGEAEILNHRGVQAEQNTDAATEATAPAAETATPVNTTAQTAQTAQAATAQTAPVTTGNPVIDNIVNTVNNNTATQQTAVPLTATATANTANTTEATATPTTSSTNADVTVTSEKTSAKQSTADSIYEQLINGAINKKSIKKNSKSTEKIEQIKAKAEADGKTVNIKENNKSYVITLVEQASKAEQKKTAVPIGVEAVENKSDKKEYDTPETDTPIIPESIKPVKHKFNVGDYLYNKAYEGRITDIRKDDNGEAVYILEAKNGKQIVVPESRIKKLEEQKKWLDYLNKAAESKKPKATGKALASNNNTGYIYETPKFSATMYFKYGNEAREGIKSKSTFEAILRGERTATTRKKIWKGHEQWANTKVGDIVKFYKNADSAGENIKVKITGKYTVVEKLKDENGKLIYRIKDDNGKIFKLNSEQWSKKEGWSPDSHFFKEMEPGDVWVNYETGIDPSKLVKYGFSNGINKDDVDVLKAEHSKENRKAILQKTKELFVDIFVPSGITFESAYDNKFDGIFKETNNLVYFTKSLFNMLNIDTMSDTFLEDVTDFIYGKFDDGNVWKQVFDKRKLNKPEYISEHEYDETYVKLLYREFNTWKKNNNITEPKSEDIIEKFIEEYYSRNNFEFDDKPNSDDIYVDGKSKKLKEKVKPEHILYKANKPRFFEASEAKEILSSDYYDSKFNEALNEQKNSTAYDKLLKGKKEKEKFYNDLNSFQKILLNCLNELQRRKVVVTELNIYYKEFINRKPKDVYKGSYYGFSSEEFSSDDVSIRDSGYNNSIKNLNGEDGYFRRYYDFVKGEVVSVEDGEGFYKSFDELSFGLQRTLLSNYLSWRGNNEDIGKTLLKYWLLKSGCSSETSLLKADNKKNLPLFNEDVYEDFISAQIKSKSEESQMSFYEFLHDDVILSFKFENLDNYKLVQNDLGYYLTDVDSDDVESFVNILNANSGDSAMLKSALMNCQVFNAENSSDSFDCGELTAVERLQMLKLSDMSQYTDFAFSDEDNDIIIEIKKNAKVSYEEETDEYHDTFVETPFQYIHTENGEGQTINAINPETGKYEPIQTYVNDNENGKSATERKLEASQNLYSDKETTLSHPNSIKFDSDEFFKKNKSDDNGLIKRFDHKKKKYFIPAKTNVKVVADDEIKDLQRKIRHIINQVITKLNNDFYNDVGDTKLDFNMFEDSLDNKLNEISDRFSELVEKYGDNIPFSFNEFVNSSNEEREDFYHDFIDKYSRHEYRPFTSILEEYNSIIYRRGKGTYSLKNLMEGFFNNRQQFYRIIDETVQFFESYYEYYESSKYSKDLEFIEDNVSSLLKLKEELISKEEERREQLVAANYANFNSYRQSDVLLTEYDDLLEREGGFWKLCEIYQKVLNSKNIAITFGELFGSVEEDKVFGLEKEDPRFFADVPKSDKMYIQNLYKENERKIYYEKNNSDAKAVRSLSGWKIGNLLVTWNDFGGESAAKSRLSELAETIRGRRTKVVKQEDGEYKYKSINTDATEIIEAEPNENGIHRIELKNNIIKYRESDIVPVENYTLVEYAAVNKLLENRFISQVIITEGYISDVNKKANDSYLVCCEDGSMAVILSRKAENGIYKSALHESVHSYVYNAFCYYKRHHSTNQVTTLLNRLINASGITKKQYNEAVEAYQKQNIYVDDDIKEEILCNIAAGINYLGIDFSQWQDNLIYSNEFERMLNWDSDAKRVNKPDEKYLGEADTTPLEQKPQSARNERYKESNRKKKWEYSDDVTLTSENKFDRSSETIDKAIEERFRKPPKNKAYGKALANELDSEDFYSKEYWDERQFVMEERLQKEMPYRKGSGTYISLPGGYMVWSSYSPPVRNEKGEFVQKEGYYGYELWKKYDDKNYCITIQYPSYKKPSRQDIIETIVKDTMKFEDNRIYAHEPLSNVKTPIIREELKKILKVGDNGNHKLQNFYNFKFDVLDGLFTVEINTVKDKKDAKLYEYTLSNEYGQIDKGHIRADAYVSPASAIAKMIHYNDVYYGNTHKFDELEGLDEEVEEDIVEETEEEQGEIVSDSDEVYEYSDNDAPPETSEDDNFDYQLTDEEYSQLNESTPKPLRNRDIKPKENQTKTKEKAEVKPEAEHAKQETPKLKRPAKQDNKPKAKTKSKDQTVNKYGFTKDEEQEIKEDQLSKDKEHRKRFKSVSDEEYEARRKADKEAPSNAEYKETGDTEKANPDVDEDWKKAQDTFGSAHKYVTDAAKRMTEIHTVFDNDNVSEKYKSIGLRIQHEINNLANLFVDINNGTADIISLIDKIDGWKEGDLREYLFDYGRRAEKGRKINNNLSDVDDLLEMGKELKKLIKDINNPVDADGNPIEFTGYTNNQREALGFATSRYMNAVRARIEYVSKTLDKKRSLTDEAIANGKNIEKKGVAGYLANLYTRMQGSTDTMFKAIGGFKEDSEGYKIANQVKESVAKRMQTYVKALSYFNEIKDTKDFQGFLHDTSKYKLKEFEGFEDREFTIQQIVSMYRMLKSVKNTKGLSFGDVQGIAIKNEDGSHEFLPFKDTFTDIYGNEKKLANDSYLNAIIRLHNECYSIIQKNDTAMAYNQACDEMFDDIGIELDALREELTGLGLGKMGYGCYTPIHWVMPESDTKDSDWIYEPNKEYEQREPGFFFERSAHVKRYLSIAPISQVVENYIQNASEYLGTAKLKQDLKIYQTNSNFAHSFSNTLGEYFGKNFENWYDAYVDDLILKSNIDNGLLSKMRSMMAGGTLMGSPSVIMKQSSSFFSATGLLNPEAVKLAYSKKLLFKNKGMSKFNDLLKYREVNNELSKTFAMSLNESFFDKLAEKSKVVGFFKKGIEKKDYVTVEALYMATVYDRLLAHMDEANFDVTSKEFQKEVDDLFMEVEFRSQPMFDVELRPEYNRTDNELVRLLTMFRTQQTQNLNLIVSAIGEYKAYKGTDKAKEKADKLKNTAKGQLAAAVSLSLLTIAADLFLHNLKKYRDDDDEIAVSKILGRFMLNTVESGASTVWMGDNLAKWLIDTVSGGDTSEYYGVNMGPITTVESMLESIQYAVQSPTPANIKNVLTYGTQMMGIPANNVYRLLNSAIMYTCEVTGQNPNDYDDILKKAYHDFKTDEKNSNAQSSLRDLGLSKKESASYIYGIDADDSGLTQKELKAYYKEHPDEEAYVSAMWNAMGFADDWDTVKNKLDDEIQYESNPIYKSIDSDESKSISQSEILDYYLNNKDSYDELESIWNAHGWSSSFEDKVTALEAKESKEEASDAFNQDNYSILFDYLDTQKNHGKSYLTGLIQEDTDDYNSSTTSLLLDYIYSADISDADRDTYIPYYASSKYVNTYKTLRSNGYSSKEAMSMIDTLDTNGNSYLTQSELAEYYMEHNDDEELIAEIWNASGWSKTWAEYKKSKKIA